MWFREDEEVKDCSRKPKPPVVYLNKPYFRWTFNPAVLTKVGSPGTQGAGGVLAAAGVLGAVGGSPPSPVNSSQQGGVLPQQVRFSILLGLKTKVSFPVNSLSLELLLCKSAI